MLRRHLYVMLTILWETAVSNTIIRALLGAVPRTWCMLPTKFTPSTLLVLLSMVAQRPFS